MTEKHAPPEPGATPDTDRRQIEMRALAKRRAHVEHARHEVNAFIEYVIKDDRDNKPVRQGRIHREWQQLGDLYNRLLLIGPKQHGKTKQAIGRALFKLGRNPNELLKFIGASDKSARKRLHSITQNMDDNEDLHRVFPHLDTDRCPVVNKSMIYIERDIRSPDPSIEAKGITSAATGDRATGLIADDAVDFRNSVMQPKLRRMIKEGWGDWYSLLSPTGWLFWISNLWSMDDLTHELMANPAYAVGWYELNSETFGSLVRYPDGQTRESKEPLWPEFWGKPQLRDVKRAIKPRQFAKLYCLRPMVEGEQQISKDWIRPWKRPPGDDWERVMVLDLAESQEQGADPVGGVLFAVHPEKQVIKVEDAWGGHYPFPEKVRMLRNRRRVHRVKHIAAENSAGALSLAQHIIPRYKIAITLIPTKGKRKSIWMEEATPFLEALVVQFNPKLINKSCAMGGTGELDQQEDIVAQLLNLGSFPFDDLADAFSRGIFHVTYLYEIFDGEIDPMDDDIEDHEIAVSADDYQEKYKDLEADDGHSQVLLI